MSEDRPYQANKIASRPGVNFLSEVPAWAISGQEGAKWADWKEFVQRSRILSYLYWEARNAYGVSPPFQLIIHQGKVQTVPFRPTWSWGPSQGHGCQVAWFLQVSRKTTLPSVRTRDRNAPRRWKELLCLEDPILSPIQLMQPLYGRWVAFMPGYWCEFEPSDKEFNLHIWLFPALWLFPWPLRTRVLW